MNAVSFLNPYDFVNPVSDECVFVGREGQLRDIHYYLGRAEVTPRPIHLAIIGARGFGKTSLLNMAELEARRRQFCAVRIDLDESDAQSQDGFFFKLFDGILDAAVAGGAFGGRQSTIYRTYLDVLGGYGERGTQELPFLFPAFHAWAMKTGPRDAQVPDSVFRSDLVLLRAEVNRPIIVLIDEANVFAENRVLLQKVRSIFTRTPGFMLIAAGTPDLFPAIDRVYSPIGRQFKKIFLGRFATLEETELCVRRPLEKAGIGADEIFDFSRKNLRTLHDVADGRPYETQLVCHVMFRRMQDAGAQRMALDLEVLSHVGRELEDSKDWFQRVHELHLLERPTGTSRKS